MKKEITIAIIIMAILIVIMGLTGCGYKGSLLIKDNEIIAHSNRPMEITKVVNKEGVVSYTYSSKKDSGWMENLLTLIGLKAVNK